MKVTKYGHACIVVENAGRSIVIDPGEFTELPDELSGIEIVVLTHEHADHSDPTNIAIIHALNPDVVAYGTKGALTAIKDVPCKKIVVDATTHVELCGIDVEFQLEDHAVIWQQSPCENIAVTIGSFIHYPGDSFTKSSRPVAVLALPVSGPWLKLSESMALAIESDARYVLPTHNGLLNDIGHQIVHAHLTKVLGATEKKLLLLRNGEEFAE